MEREIHSTGGQYATCTARQYPGGGGCTLGVPSSAEPGSLGSKFIENISVYGKRLEQIVDFMILLDPNVARSRRSQDECSPDGGQDHWKPGIVPCFRDG
jgi:hypothetical protein